MESAHAGGGPGLDDTAGPWPALGFGLGFRPHFYADLLRDGGEQVDWLEVMSDDVLEPGTARGRQVERLRADFPIVLHGVALSIASTAPLDRAYVGRLRALADRVQPAWVSDHLCWTGVHGRHLHDLLPVPYTREALDHVAGRIDTVQEALGRPLVLENVSSYVRFRRSEMPEWTFIAALVQRTGCRLLLDVSNVHVSACNQGFDAAAFLAGLPPEAVVQMHLGGYSREGAILVDTHDAPIDEAVWRLYAEALRRFGAVATTVECDDPHRPFAEVVAELARARACASDVAPDGGHR